MRLRRLLLGMIATVLLVTGLMAILQMRKTLRTAFDALNATHYSQLHELLRATLQARILDLRHFGDLIESDQNLAGLFIISRESGDRKLVEVELERIRRRTDFDVVDLLPLEGGTSLIEGWGLSENDISATKKRANRSFCYAVGNSLFLATLSPLRLYDETVGYVLLGLRVERAIAKETSGHASLRFTLSDSSTASVGVASLDGKSLGLALFETSPYLQQMSSSLRNHLLLFIATGLSLLGAILYLWLEFGFTRKLRILALKVHEAAMQLRDGRLPALSLGHQSVQEIQLVITAFEQFSSSLKSYDQAVREQSRLAAEAEKRAALSEMARQLAHDIRSPLSSLDMMLSNEDLGASKHKSSIRSTLQRLRSIANDILKKNTDTVSSPVALTVLELLEEKKLQYRGNSALHFYPDPERSLLESEYGLFVSLASDRLKRVLSNLIDNGVEACQGAGRISVSLSSLPGKIAISVSDTGCGIPKELQAHLGERGFTQGKSGGSGLGLSYAKTTVEEVGGKLEVHSQPGSGTNVTLSLPLSPAPEWFLPALSLPPGTTIVIVDDEWPIHQLWAERFKDYLVRLIHFTTPAELREFAQKDRGEAGPWILLCDENLDENLKEEGEGGLAVIEELSLAKPAVLVTGAWQDPSLQRRAILLNVRVLPKELIPYLPLSRENPQKLKGQIHWIT